MSHGWATFRCRTAARLAQPVFLRHGWSRASNLSTALRRQANLTNEISNSSAQLFARLLDRDLPARRLISFGPPPKREQSEYPRQVEGSRARLWDNDIDQIGSLRRESRAALRADGRASVYAPILGATAEM